MHLACNHCAQYGVHEDSNKQVFLVEGTSWCQPHYDEFVTAERKRILQSVDIITGSWRL